MKKQYKLWCAFSYMKANTFTSIKKFDQITELTKTLWPALPEKSAFSMLSNATTREFPFTQVLVTEKNYLKRITVLKNLNRKSPNTLGLGLEIWGPSESICLSTRIPPVINMRYSLSPPIANREHYQIVFTIAVQDKLYEKHEELLSTFWHDLTALTPNAHKFELSTRWYFIKRGANATNRSLARFAISDIISNPTEIKKLEKEDFIRDGAQYEIVKVW